MPSSSKESPKSFNQVNTTTLIPKQEKQQIAAETNTTDSTATPNLNSEDNNKDLKCSHCGRFGHSALRCYHNPSSTTYKSTNSANKQQRSSNSRRDSSPYQRNQRSSNRSRSNSPHNRYQRSSTTRSSVDDNTSPVRSPPRTNTQRNSTRSTTPPSNKPSNGNRNDTKRTKFDQVHLASYRSDSNETTFNKHSVPYSQQLLALPINNSYHSAREKSASQFMHNDKFDDNSLISSHSKPTNPLRASTSGPADLLTAYPYPNRSPSYPHSDALDRLSTTSPADNSHGHPAGEPDKTLSGVPIIQGHSNLRRPSKSYYIGYALLNDLPRLCKCSHSMSWQCPHARPGGNPLRNFCDFHSMSVSISCSPPNLMRNIRNPNYCDLPLMRDTATTTALRMNLHRSGHSTTYTVMGACDYYETYGVAPKSYLVFPNDLVFNDEEAALYLSLYKELPPSYVHKSDPPGTPSSTHGHRLIPPTPIIPDTTDTMRTHHPVSHAQTPPAHLTNPLIFMMHSTIQSTTTNRPTDSINLEPRNQLPTVHDTIRDFVRRETITLLTNQPTETYVQSLRRQQHSLLDAQIAENQRIDQQLLDLDRESRRLQRLRSDGESSIALLQAFSATIHSQTSHLSTAVTPMESAVPSQFTRPSDNPPAPARPIYMTRRLDPSPEHQRSQSPPRRRRRTEEPTPTEVQPHQESRPDTHPSHPPADPHNPTAPYTRYRRYPTVTGTFHNLTQANPPSNQPNPTYPDPRNVRETIPTTSLVSADYPTFDTLTTLETYTRNEMRFTLQGQELTRTLAEDRHPRFISVPEYIQYYWQRIEFFHWLPENEDTLREYFEVISFNLGEDRSRTRYFHTTIPNRVNSNSNTITLYNLWIQPALDRLRLRLRHHSDTGTDVSSSRRNEPPAPTRTPRASSSSTPSRNVTIYTNTEPSTSSGWGASDTIPTWQRPMRTNLAPSHRETTTISLNHLLRIHPRHQSLLPTVDPTLLHDPTTLSEIQTYLLPHEKRDLLGFSGIINELHSHIETSAATLSNISIHRHLLTDPNLRESRRAWARNILSNTTGHLTETTRQLEHIDLRLESDESTQTLRDRLLLNDITTMHADLSSLQESIQIILSQHASRYIAVTQHESNRRRNLTQPGK